MMDEIIKECKNKNMDIFLILNEKIEKFSAYDSIKISKKYRQSSDKWNILFKIFLNKNRIQMYLVRGKFQDKYTNTINTDSIICSLKYAS